MAWLFSQKMVENLENSPFLPVQAADCSEVTCLDGKPSAQSKSTPMPQAFLWQDSKTAFSLLSRYGMTLETLTADRGEALLTSYLAAFPVRTSPVQAKVPESTEKEADSGKKWQESFLRYNPNTSSWKTHQCLFDEDLPELSVILPKWGMTVNGVVYQRRNLARPMSEIEYGLKQDVQWATPTTMDKLPPKSQTALLREATVTRAGRKRPANLRDQVSRPHMWPTPTASASKGSSPAALTRKNGRCRKNDRLDHAVGDSRDGRLNPEFCEYLMGWPTGMTELSPLAMDRFHEWLQQHGFC